MIHVSSIEKPDFPISKSEHHSPLCPNNDWDEEEDGVIDDLPALTKDDLDELETTLSLRQKRRTLVRKNYYVMIFSIDEVYISHRFAKSL